MKAAREVIGYPDRPRNALVIGPDFYGYNQAVAKALQKEGFEVTVIDSPTHNPKGLINRIRIDLAGKLGITKYRRIWMKNFNKKILEKSREMEFEFILLIKGDWICPEIYKKMSASRKAIWFQDIAIRCGSNHVRLAKLSDAVFVFEETDIEYLKNNGIEQDRLYFLPMAFDEDIYNKKQCIKNIDVSFVGRMYGNRERIISKLMTDLPDVRFEIWGRYLRYQEPRTWLQWLKRSLNPRLRQAYRNRDIRPSFVNYIYNRSKIVLNIHHAQSKNGCNPRVFEIMGSGAFQICDENNFVKKHVCAEIIQFKNPNELVQLISHFLKTQIDRENIAISSYVASRSHSFDARIRELIARI